MFSQLAVANPTIIIHAFLNAVAVLKELSHPYESLWILILMPYAGISNGSCRSRLQPIVENNHSALKKLDVKELKMKGSLKFPSEVKIFL